MTPAAEPRVPPRSATTETHTGSVAAHLINPMLSPRSISARMAAVHARAMARSDGTGAKGNIDVLSIDAGIAERK